MVYDLRYLIALLDDFLYLSFKVRHIIDLRYLSFKIRHIIDLRYLSFKIRHIKAEIHLVIVGEGEPLDFGRKPLVVLFLGHPEIL